MSGVDSVRAISVVADPTRAAILNLMLTSSDGRVLVGHTASLLGLRQPTVSHHMKALLDEGIVTREPHGRQTWYSIAERHRQRIQILFNVDLAGEERQIDLSRVIEDLACRFDGDLSPEQVARVVVDSSVRLAESASPRMLTSRTAAFSIARLEAQIQGRGDFLSPMVVFLCPHNAGRSQIAAAILRHLAGDRVRVRSAGSAPSPEVRSAVISALDEIGVPLGAEFPKPLTDDVLASADVVVTMGCGPLDVSASEVTVVDWVVGAHAGGSTSDVRAMRDEIDGRVRRLIGELLSEDTVR